MSVSNIQAGVETQNVVVSTSIDQELDLETLNDDLDQASYDPDHFPAIRYPIEEPEATVLLYRSGEIIGTGAKSIEEAQDAVERACESLQRRGVACTRETTADVENIVSTANLEQRLNLDAVAIGLGLEHVEYEPEQFPGLIYRLPDTRAVVLIFASGKVVITRCRTTAQGQEAIQTVVDRLIDLGLLDDRESTFGE
jgi:transcription initiation factor TFIID TATA-box-binding protein